MGNLLAYTECHAAWFARAPPERNKVQKGVSFMCGHLRSSSPGTVVVGRRMNGSRNQEPFSPYSWDCLVMTEQILTPVILFSALEVFLMGEVSQGFSFMLVLFFNGLAKKMPRLDRTCRGGHTLWL